MVVNGAISQFQQPPCSPHVVHTILLHHYLCFSYINIDRNTTRVYTRYYNAEQAAEQNADPPLVLLVLFISPFTLA